MDIKKIDVDKVAAAIEADAGEALPDLRQALAEARAGVGRSAKIPILARPPTSAAKSPAPLVMTHR